MALVSEAATSSFPARLANVRYAEKEYWNTRYTSQPCEFDWFYGYTALRKIVRTFIKRKKSVLHVGCGNSNFQEGMAKDGYQVVNTDISEVVIEQMMAKHKGIANLRYVVADCRNMPEFFACQFGSVIDKGTVDALLCSKDAADNIRSMFREISRVLIPGGVFLLVTLGGPAQRLSLVNQPEFDWTVQVCMVRRVPEDQYAPSAAGRAIPLNDTVKPLSYIGPLEVQPDGGIVGLPEPFDPAAYFYAYVCRRSPLVLPTDNQAGKDGKARLPDGWKATVRAVAEVVSGELRLPQGILGRGRRVKITSRANFERIQRERELEWERRICATAADSDSQTSNMDTLRNPHNSQRQQQEQYRQYQQYQQFDQHQRQYRQQGHRQEQQEDPQQHDRAQHQPYEQNTPRPRPKTAPRMTTTPGPRGFPFTEEGAEEGSDGRHHHGSPAEWRSREQMDAAACECRSQGTLEVLCRGCVVRNRYQSKEQSEKSTTQQSELGNWSPMLSLTVTQEDSSVEDELVLVTQGDNWGSNLTNGTVTSIDLIPSSNSAEAVLSQLSVLPPRPDIVEAGSDMRQEASTVVAEAEAAPPMSTHQAALIGGSWA